MLGISILLLSLVPGLGMNQGFGIVIKLLPSIVIFLNFIHVIFGLLVLCLRQEVRNCRTSSQLGLRLLQAFHELDVGVVAERCV